MNKLFTLSVVLAAGAITTPAQAEVFRGLFTSRTTEAVGGDYAMPMQSMTYGDSYGYPFYSGCCEPAAPCCGGLWDGYCGHGCGLFGGRRHWGCGHKCSPCGYGYGYGHSTCGACADGCGKHHHGWWGLRHHRKHCKVSDCDTCKGGKGGWSYGSSYYGSPTEVEAPSMESVPAPTEVPLPPPTESAAGRLFPRLRPISF